MNTKMKMLSLLLCFVMLVGLMPTTALAADTYTITLNSPTEADVFFASASSAKAGDIITVRAVATWGYGLASLTATWADGEVTLTAKQDDPGAYTFTMPAADVTVTAIFAPIYKITFEPNGGVFTSEGVPEYALWTGTDGKLTQAQIDDLQWGFYRDDYIYDHANTKLDGSGEKIDAQHVFTSDTTVYVQWTPVTYTVTFDACGGTGTMADATGVSGEYTLPEIGFTAPDGMQFKAWSVDGAEKAVGDKITVTDNITVIAIWEDLPAGHICDIAPVAKVDPSCTQSGKEAYYKCDGCGKFYEDALGTVEIADLADWGNLAALGHTESDWKSDAHNHWKECTAAACGVILENSTAAHTDADIDGRCDVCDLPVDLDAPQTDDNNMTWLWVTLLVVSVFGVLAAIVISRKRSFKK